MITICDVESPYPSGVVPTKGWSVRPLKRYVIWVQSVDNTALYVSNSIKAPTNIGETLQAHFWTKCRAELDGNTEGRKL